VNLLGWESEDREDEAVTSTLMSMAGVWPEVHGGDDGLAVTHHW